MKVREVFLNEVTKAEVYFFKNPLRHMDSVLPSVLGKRALALEPML